MKSKSPTPLPESRVHRPGPGRQSLSLLLLSTALLAGAPLAAGQEEEKPPPKPPAAGPTAAEPFHPFVTTKDGIPIEKFIYWASQALNAGRPEKDRMSFIWSPTARATANQPQKKVVTTAEMRIPHSALLDFVRTNLRVHDLALVPVGPRNARFILIENLQNPTLMRSHKVFVPEEELDDYKDSYIPIVTTVHVEHVNVQQIQTQIQRLSQQTTPYGAAIIPAPSENAFIIVDFAPEVYNLARLIREMDKQGVKFDQTLEIIELHHAGAGEMETMLSQIVLEEGGPGTPGTVQPGVPQPFGGPKQPPPPKIIPDERTNRLVIYATPEDHERIRKLVEQLDTEVPPSTGNVHVYGLKNSVAEDLVETLKEIIEGQGGGGTRPTPGPTQGSISTATGPTKVDIVADKGSNSVLIRGTKSKIQEVVELIKQLDKRRPQVLVEAAILELQQDDFIKLGVELGAFDAKANLASTQRPFGLTQFGGLSTIAIGPQGIARLPVPSTRGFVGGIFDGNAFGFPVIVQALQDKGYGNLLSMPSLLTNDNAEASIKVSRQVPTEQTQFGTGTAPVGTQTFGGYEEAPIELTISPHIASDEYLRLDLTFRVEVFGAPTSANLPPPKTTREIKTAITVPDGATVVIGGLTLDEQLESISQVPILGDLPLLGALFRIKDTTHRKNTLVLFLTPRILSQPDFRDLDDLSTRKKTMIARLKGQIDLVDPEFGRRFKMLDKTKTIEDIEKTGAFDFPVIHSPADEEGREAAPEKSPGRAPPKAPEGGRPPAERARTPKARPARTPKAGASKREAPPGEPPRR